MKQDTNGRKRKFAAETWIEMNLYEKNILYIRQRDGQGGIIRC